VNGNVIDFLNRNTSAELGLVWSIADLYRAGVRKAGSRNCFALNGGDGRSWKLPVEHRAGISTPVLDRKYCMTYTKLFE
jgi:hypothetical protein